MEPDESSEKSIMWVLFNHFECTMSNQKNTKWDADYFRSDDWSLQYPAFRTEDWVLRAPEEDQICPKSSVKQLEKEEFSVSVK